MLSFAADVREGGCAARSASRSPTSSTSASAARISARHGDAGARALRAPSCAAISSPTSTAPTSATRCAASTRRGRCSSSRRRPSPPLETMTNAATARAWIAQALGEAAVGDHFAAVSTELDKVAAVRHPADARVRLLGLGRRPLFGVVGDRPAAGDRDRARPLQRVPARRHEMDEHFRAAPLEREHPDADGADRRLVPQHPGLRDPWGDALRPAARALPRLSPATGDGSNGKRVQLDGAPAIRRPARWSGASPAPTASTPSSSSSTRARRSCPSISWSPRRRPTPMRIITICWSPTAWRRGRR